MTQIGLWRIYFNRLQAAPLVWCVALVDWRGGDVAWELAVAHVEWRVPGKTVHRPKPVADDEDGMPSAWVECEGRLELGADGVARIVQA